MTYDLLHASLILNPFNGNSMGVVWVIRLVLCKKNTRVVEISSFINTVTPNFQRTKGFVFIANVLFSTFDIVKHVLPRNPELHQQLNPIYPYTHGSLEYKIERNKLLLPLMYLFKTMKLQNESLRSNANVLQP